MTDEAKPAREPKRRSNYLPAPHYFALNQACTLIDRSFGTCPYLVGSALERADYRDVDVRLILPDEQYDRWFNGLNGTHDAYWTLLCLSISTWLREQTGLPVDFQIQRQTQANAEHGKHAGKKRNPLGIFLDYPGERPSDVAGAT